MNELLLRRAALLQAKLKVLEERKNCFTDHNEILAFHRLKKEFDAVVSHHQDKLTADPLRTIKDDFEKDKALIDKLRRINAEARLHNVALSGQQSGSLTSEFLQGTIEWLTSQKASLEKQLRGIQSCLSHEHWDKNSGELLPYAKAIAEALSEYDLLAPGTGGMVTMASMRGPRYEELQGTLASIEAAINKKILYVMRSADRLGPFALDDLDKLLSERTVFAFDVAWYAAVGEWQPLFELATSLSKLDILRTSDKTAPFIEALLRRKLFYLRRAGEAEVRGPFFVDDLNVLFADRMVSGSELAWHNAIADWQPLSELILVLEEHKLFHLSKFARLKSWIKAWKDQDNSNDFVAIPSRSVPVAKQPLDPASDTFDLDLPRGTTRQNLGIFFKANEAPPYVVDDYGSKTIRITGYSRDIEKLIALAQFFMKERQEHSKDQPKPPVAKNMFTVDLSTIDRRQLDKFTKPYPDILKLVSDGGSTRTYAAENAYEAEQWKIHLKNKFGSGVAVR